MKFVVSSAQLSERVQVISRALTNKTVNPVLSFLRFSIQDQLLTITGSDGDTTISGTVPVENADGNVSILLFANQLTSILPKFGERPLTFSIDERSYSVEIQIEGGKYNYIGQSADEYPQVRPLADDAAELVLTTQTLQKGIARTEFAASTDEIRPVMVGIYFDLTPDALNFVATDARQLALYQLTDRHFDNPNSFILPTRSANLLKNLLPKEQGEVVLRFDGSQLVAQTEHYTLSTRLIEAHYPNYKAVIPSQFESSAIIDNMSFRMAFERVSSFSSDNNLVRMRFEEGKVCLLSQNIDFSLSAEEFVPCQYNGQPLEIGVKAKLMMGILQNMDAQQFELRLIDPTRPIIILPLTEEENTKTTLLLTPMTL